MKLILFFIFFSSTNVYSLTITEIKQIAIERSSALNAHEMEAHALQNEANLKGKWQNPVLMGQFGTLESYPAKGSTIEMSLTQPVPLSDKYTLRKELAQLATSAQETQNLFFKNWVSHQAILTAWRVYVAQELFEHGKERAKRISIIKRYLETRPKVSIKQRVEYSIISSLLVQLEKEQDQKELELKVANNDLEFWIGKKLELSEIPFKLPDNYNVLSDFDLNTINDLELTQAKNQLKIATLDKELSQKEKRPDLFLGGGYRVEHVSPVNYFSYGIVGLNIPLWDTGTSRVEAAKVREMRDQKNLEETEKKLMLKHQKQIELVRFCVEQLKRFPKKFVDMNDRAIHEAEGGFKQGVLDVNTFIQAETQSHEVIDHVFLSWLSYLDNLSSLQLMRGEEFNWDKKR